MYKRILAIGDIHGEWDKFVSLYRQIDFQPGRDLLVFLGDYIDRGSAPLHVLKWLFAHKNNEHIIILRGNHEQMMLDYYREGGCNNLWLWNGGDVTRDALDEEDSTLKGDFLSFIKELPLSYRINANGKHFFFCHAGVDPDIPLELQDEETLLWIREEFYDYYDGEDIIVTGHTNVEYIEQGKTMPIIRNNMILMDTGSYMPHGLVSCVDVLSGRIWQSDGGL